MRFKKEFLTLSELGRVFGVGKQAVGKWLNQIGLRTHNGHPSHAAYAQDLVGFFWGEKHVWHGERTVAVLIESGWRSVVPPPQDLVETAKLEGPFRVRASANSAHEILGANGDVAVWVSGDRNAHHVCRLLNAGHRLGVLDRPPTELPPAEEPAGEVSAEEHGFVIYDWSVR